MLIDTFLYNGEADLARLRFCQLKERVGLFVMVEGTLTFTGHERTVRHDVCMDVSVPLVHQVVTAFPEASPRNAWKREMFQRNAILSSLKSYPGDALVMVSDVDELPRLEDIPETLEPGTLIRFQHEFYHFHFNNHVVHDSSARKGWSCTALCRLDDLRKWFPQGVRNRLDAEIIRSGWHLSWMHKPEEKLKSYSHFRDLTDIPGDIVTKVKTRWDYEYEYVPGTSHLPHCIQENIEYWKPYLRDEDAPDAHL